MQAEERGRNAVTCLASHDDGEAAYVRRKSDRNIYERWRECHLRGNISEEGNAVHGRRGVHEVLPISGKRKGQ